MWREGLLRPLSPLLSKPKRLALGLPQHRGVWAGHCSSPSSQIGKLRPRVLMWVPKKKKKESKRPPKRLPEVMHDPLRVPQAAPFLRQPSPTSCLRYGNGLPALLSDSFLQSTLENAVYLWLPSHSVSPLHVLEGLQVPEGCAKTTAVSGGCGLDNETKEPAGGAEG